MNRVHNFSAGPARLPLEVLKKAKSELVNYQRIGASVMEISHRSDAYTKIDRQAKSRIQNLLGLGDNFHIMFLQGGASSQFMMVPHNFLAPTRTADYIDTGRWSAKAIKEAKLFGQINVPFSSADTDYDRVLSGRELTFTDDAAYVHFTSNNTVAGTQFPSAPKTKAIPLVCDASSDFLARPIENIENYGLIYAGAQKNVGPAGVTIVIVRKDFLEQANRKNVPTILQYQTHAERIFNTPPVFNVYMVNLVLEWIQNKGGVDYFVKINKQKAQLLYDEIDRDEFYRGRVQKKSRSLMNVTFRLPDEELEQKFLEEAEEHQLAALKGHRSVGGIRVSIYNACPLESVEALVRFMQEFRDRRGY
jgi:phosphoserine aminotransferase